MRRTDDRHATESVTPEYWDDRIAVNSSTSSCAQAVLPDMQAAEARHRQFRLGLLMVGQAEWWFTRGEIAILG